MKSIRPRRRRPSTPQAHAHPFRRFLDIGLAFAILGLLALVAARLDRIETQRLAGVPVVNDGDTLTLGGERIRLRGIDAPEYKQICDRGGRDYACGREALQALRSLVAGRTVACEGWERDRYGRLLAVCRADGRDLGASMVEAGWAVAYGGYHSEEAAARAGRAGLWAGSFDRPTDWRTRHGGMLETQHDSLMRIVDWLRQLF